MANTFDVINTSKQPGVSVPRINYEEEARLVQQRREEARRRLERELFTKQYTEQLKKIEQEIQRRNEAERRQSPRSGNESRAEQMQESRSRINEFRSKPFWLAGNMLGRSLVQYGHEYGVPGPLATAAGWWATPVHGAGYATKSLGIMSTKLRQNQLGTVGRFYRGTQLMNLGLSNLSSIGYLGAMMGQNIASPRSAATSLIGKMVSGGAGGMWTGLGATVAASTIAAMMKSKKEQTLHGRMIAPPDVSRKYSQWRFFRPLVDRLVADGTIKPGEALTLNLLGLIEQWVSPIPLFVANEMTKEQFKSRSARTGVKEIGKEESFLEKILSKGEQVLQTATYKYNPVAQLFTFLFTGKTPKGMLDTIESVYGKKEITKEQAAEAGVTFSVYQLLHTSSQTIMSRVRSYEAQMMSFSAAQYELAKGIVSELITIRRSGFGLSDQAITVTEPSKKPLYKVILGMYEHIPVLAAGINVLKKLFKISTTSLKDIREKLVEKTQSIVDKILGKFGSRYRDPVELLKETGLYKPIQDQAFEYIAQGLPNSLADIYVSGERRLDVLQSILQHFTQQGPIYETYTEKQIWDKYRGQYLLPDEYSKEEFRRSKIIESILEPRSFGEKIQEQLAKVFSKFGYKTVSDRQTTIREAKQAEQNIVVTKYTDLLDKIYKLEVEKSKKPSVSDKLTNMSLLSGAGLLSLASVGTVPLSMLTTGMLGLTGILSRRYGKSQKERIEETKSRFQFIKEPIGIQSQTITPKTTDSKSKPIVQESTVRGEIDEAEQRRFKTKFDKMLNVVLNTLPSIEKHTDETSEHLVSVEKGLKQKKKGLFGKIFDKIMEIASAGIGMVKNVFASATGRIIGAFAGTAVGGVMGSMFKRIAGALGGTALGTFIGQTSLSTLGIYGLIGGVIAYGAYRLVKDMIEGYKEDGIKGMLKSLFTPSKDNPIWGTAGKYAMYGAGIGLMFGPPGAIVGGLIGGGLGSLVGYLFSEDKEGKTLAGKIWDKIKKGFKAVITDKWAQAGAVAGTFIGGPVGFIAGGLIGYGLHKVYNWFFPEDTEKKAEKEGPSIVDSVIEKMTGLKGGLKAIWTKLTEIYLAPIKTVWNWLKEKFGSAKAKTQVDKAVQNKPRQLQPKPQKQFDFAGASSEEIQLWYSMGGAAPYAGTEAAVKFREFLRKQRQKGKQSQIETQSRQIITPTKSSTTSKEIIQSFDKSTTSLREDVKKVVEKTVSSSEKYVTELKNQYEKIVQNLKEQNESLLQKLDELATTLSKQKSEIVPMPIQTQQVPVGYAKDSRPDHKDVDIEDPVIRNIIENLFSLSIKGLKEEMTMFALGQPDMGMGI